MMAACEPLRVESSITVTENEAVVWPAGTVTEDGTVAREVRLEARETVVSAAGAEGNVTVPLTGAEPSMALAASEMAIGFTVKFMDASELIPLAATVTE